MNTKPSLGISGNDKVLSGSDSLKIDINYKNTDGYMITAVIQKERDGSYQGEYYREVIQSNGDHTFTLKGTDGAGKYRVWITVADASTQQTVLEVPYYFIIQ